MFTFNLPLFENMKKDDPDVYIIFLTICAIEIVFFLLSFLAIAYDKSTLLLVGALKNLFCFGIIGYAFKSRNMKSKTLGN